MVKRCFFIALVFLFNSCFDQGDCLITSTNIVMIDLETLAGVPRETTFLRVLRADSTVHFPDYENTFSPITTLALPLDPDKNQSSFNFYTSDSVEYHLTLGYSTYSRVISTDCGAFLYFTDLSVVKSTFDSTRVTSPQLLLGVTENLKVFF
jgi:hypothetical protein